MAPTNGNGQVALIFKVASVLVPVFTALTMFGVAYGLAQIGEARESLADLRERLAKMEATLDVRVSRADAEHATYDRRIDRLETSVYGRAGN